MNPNGHRYTVELRVSGETLDPEMISRETGLKPCRTRPAGSRVGNRTYPEAMWGFDGDGPYDWPSLEEGLTYVLDRLTGFENVFAKYREEHEVIWWCGHFQTSFDGGPLLSGRLLKRLAEFGAELFIDTYFSQPKPNDDPPPV